VAKFEFDGPNKRIIMKDDTVINGVSSFSVTELWTEWCDWMVLDDNLKYAPALDSLMVPLSATEFVGPYLFMRNDLGWMGVPPQVNPCTVMIEGSFFGSDPNSPVMVNHTAQATDLIINRSTLTSTMVTSGVSGPTAAEIAAEVWNALIDNYVNPESAGYALANLSGGSGSLTQEQNDQLMNTLTTATFIGMK